MYEDGYCKQVRSNQGTGNSRQSFGAIAYSPSTGETGYSFGFSSRAASEQRAKRECGQSDCQIAAWYPNSCGALAVGDDGTWRGGLGSTESGARQDAQSDCMKAGGKNCKVIEVRCSR